LAAVRVNLNPVRVLTQRRSAKRQERQAFRALMERLLAELERPEWERHPYRPRKRTAQIIAEQAWARRGFTPKDQEEAP
jgi:hypothetical protein